MSSRVVAALSMVGFALTLLALVGPWWVVNVSGFSHAGYSSDTIQFAPFGSTSTIRGDGPIGDYRNASNTSAVFVVAALLTGLGALAGVAMVALAALPRKGLRRRRMAGLLGLTASILLLAAALWVMARLPAAVSQDIPKPLGPFSFYGFWGSTTVYGFDAVATFVYGAGWAWYAALVAAVLFLMAPLVLFRARALLSV